MLFRNEILTGHALHLCFCSDTVILCMARKDHVSLFIAASCETAVCVCVCAYVISPKVLDECVMCVTKLTH